MPNTHTHCHSYCFVVGIKHHDQRDLLKKEFIRAYGYRRIRVHYGEKAWQQEQEVSASVLNFLHEVDCELGVVRDFKLSRLTCRDYFLQQDDTS